MGCSRPSHMLTEFKINPMHEEHKMKQKQNPLGALKLQGGQGGQFARPLVYITGAGDSRVFTAHCAWWGGCLALSSASCCHARVVVCRTLCPSGLRGWTQVPLARAAWVQTPQASCASPLFVLGRACSPRSPLSYTALI